MVNSLREQDEQDALDERGPLLPQSASASTLHSAADDVSSSTLPGDGGEDGISQTSRSKAKPQLGRLRATGISFCMWILIFLQAINMSGMPMAQSSIADDLKVYGSAPMWFTTSYVISMSCGGPIVGRLAGAILPPRILIAFASIIFAIGGVLTATAASFGGLVGGRVVAGIGGAGILTLAIILVIQIASDKSRGILVGLVNVGFTIGLSLGAVIFGAAVPSVGWRILFALQSPVSLLAGLGVFFCLPKDLEAEQGPKDARPLRQKLANVDYLGAFLMIATIVLFLSGLSGQVMPSLLIASFVGLITFLMVEYKIASEPIIPLQVLSSKGVLFSCLAQLGFMASRWTVLFYGPIFALAVHGYSPAVAGSILIPTNAGFGLGNVIVGFFHIRRKGSFWAPTVLSIAFFSLSLLFISQFSTASVSPALYIFLVFLNGLCTGAAMNYTLHHLLHLSAPENHFVATSLLGTFRGFAGSFGVAIGGGVFSRTLQQSLATGFKHIGDSKDRHNLVQRLIGSPAMVFFGNLSDEEHLVAVESYVAALKYVFTGAFFLAILVIGLQAATGWKGAIPDEEEDEDEIEAAMENRGVEGD